MSTRDQFEQLCRQHGSDVVFHRETGGTECPCRSPEGYRSLKWHHDHPGSPLCNEEGFLDPSVVSVTGKAFCQPVQSGATRRLTTDYANLLFGEVENDDHVGMFPLQFENTYLDFSGWSQAGEDYILYEGRRFTIVNVNRIPAPDTGTLHHYETGLRLIKLERPNG